MKNGKTHTLSLSKIDRYVYGRCRDVEKIGKYLQRSTTTLSDARLAFDTLLEMHDDDLDCSVKEK